MKKVIKLLFNLLFFIFLFVLSSCFKKLPETEQSSNYLDKYRTLSFQAGELGHLPWDLDASFPVKANFSSAVFTPLVQVGPFFELKPGIINTWRWHYESKSFIFKINRKLKFSDDRPLRLEDVEFAFLKNFLSKEGLTSKGTLSSIVGTEHLKIGQKFKSGMCPGLKILDNSTIQLYLKNNNPYFIYSLITEIPWIAPVEDFSDDLFSFNNIPRGTGPYKVVEVDKNERFILLEEKKESKSQIIKKIKFFIKDNPIKNNIDIGMGAGTKGLTEDKGYKILIGSVPAALISLEFNYDNVLARDINFRKAVYLALNRAEIFKDYKQIKGSHSFIPKNYIGSTNSHIIESSSDSEKSRAMFKQIQLKIPNRKVVAFFHGKNFSNYLPKYIQNIQGQLNKAGLSVIFKSREELTNFNDENGVVFKIHGSPISIADPLSSFTRFLTYGVKRLRVSPGYDTESHKIINKIKVSTDRKEISEYLNKLDALFRKKVVAIPLGEIRPLVSMKEKLELNINELLMAVPFDKIEMKK